MDNRPIGVFDSGMGGLTVRAAITRAMPHESLIYFGDGANVPYGPRPRAEIIEFADRAFARLLDRGVKMAVVACNAATGAAIEHLRDKYRIPIVGMEPAVKPAALTTGTGIVGVLATAATFRGQLYKATAAQYREKVRIIETVGEGFVEIVENDLEDTPEALETVRRALEPMLVEGADRIVLGCTHYPFLVRQIADVTGDRDVRIVDSAPAIARRTEQLLIENGLCAAPEHTPEYGFLSFADDDYIRHLIRKSAEVPFLEKNP